MRRTTLPMYDERATISRIDRRLREVRSEAPAHLIGKLFKNLCIGWLRYRRAMEEHVLEHLRCR